ncbi:ATP-binding protein [Streptantibioticus cattleyicolor]|uniref:Histidine kinase/HSP90-like ATPase domain-containing protein n=1 Tax=Streptantibioticus cattleyicolor (strain ATCC 35852 / DSM 46488 / JCM 4925 / NBRC 14057 / NRRL 8057) TaxID=1003195 RepID=G8XDH2_STREN|nr:ATP-binding protein [Streptantibioticus cattleyicolor]AEW99118.1 hypothetical protein SCATT_p09250 [Streptantibioticus cattleyicolor NRRL 8057 = DSM 46488]
MTVAQHNAVQMEPFLAIAPPDRCFDLTIERHSSNAELDQHDRRRPGVIRRICRAKLRHWGTCDDLTNDVLLASTELVTNALKHSYGARIRVSLSCWPGAVRIDVDDGAPSPPACPRSAGLLDEDGRGLAIVAALADAWGRSGSTTWCLLTADASEQPHGNLPLPPSGHLANPTTIRPASQE